jgi:hypothetical protein
MSVNISCSVPFDGIHTYTHIHTYTNTSQIDSLEGLTPNTPFDGIHTYTYTYSYIH